MAVKLQASRPYFFAVLEICYAENMSSSQQHRVEMHCHTVFSPDARRTPEELVEIAAEHNVHTLSITDHNHLGAQERAAERAAKLGLRYLIGVEIDATVSTGQNCHFVCFDFDPSHPKFREMATRRSSFYPLQFLEILPHLKEYGCELELEEMEARLPERYPTNPAPTVNQWFARELLLEKNLIADKAEFTRIVGEIRRKLQTSNQQKSRPATTFETMRDLVHRAGGKVLLAHVARYHRGEMDQQLSLIEGLLENGMDGFELYHPDNVKEPGFHRLKEMAKNTDCLLSCGSDCHDAVDENRNQNFARMEVEDWVLERVVGVGK